MGCLFALFAGVFPRLALFMVWVARPKMVDAAFDSWIWPLLGLIFLPWTTLAYVVFYDIGSGRHVTGFEWFLVGLAFLLDIFSYAGGRSARAARV